MEADTVSKSAYLNVAAAAEKYAALGWVVHPLCSPREECKSPGKQPVKSKWSTLKQTPVDLNKHIMLGRNIGAVCGDSSDLTVIDLDDMNFYASLVEGIDTTNFLVSRRTTTRGHFYFRHDSKLPQRMSKKVGDKGTLLGIDILSHSQTGGGSNVVLPPSMHSSGEVYTFNREPVDVPYVPDVLRDRLLSLVAFEDELVACIKKCRKWVGNFFSEPEILHGGDGRRCMLALTSELRANGLSDGGVHFMTKIVYRQDYDKERTSGELANVSAVPWKAETLISNFPEYCDTENTRGNGCKPRRTTQTEDTGEEIDPENALSELEKQTVPTDSISKSKAAKVFLQSTFDTVSIDDLAIYADFVSTEVKEHFCIKADAIKRIWAAYISERKEAVKKTEQRGAETGFNDGSAFTAANCAKMVTESTPLFVMRDTLEFYIYDKGVFANTGTRKTALPIRQLTREIYRNEAVDEQGNNGKDPSGEFINAVLTYLEDEYYISRDDLTSDNRYLCLLNGVYDRENKELLQHSPDYRHIRQIPVKFDKDATCKQIQKFMSEIVDPQNVSVLYEALGYCLIPDTRIQKGFLLNGVGANGKSTLLKLFRRLIGAENCAQESLHALETDPYSTAELYGKMVNIYPDMASKAIYQNETIKQLIGDEGSIRARKIYCPPFNFKNTAKMVFSANRLPPVPNGDFAYFRRWILIDFPNKFTGDNKDDSIDAKIQDEGELSGLLNILLKYLDKLLERGEYSYDLSTEQVEKLYKINSDPIAAFADECLTYSEEGTPKMLVYEHYLKWCQSNGIEKTQPNPFAKRFVKLGYAPGRQSSGDRLHTWDNCAIVKSVRGEKISLDGKNQEQESNPSKGPRKTEHCCVDKKEKVRYVSSMGEIEKKNNSGSVTMQISSDETNGCVQQSVSTDNGISSVQGDFAPRTDYPDIAQFCNDWVNIYNENVNSHNVVRICMEYKEKRKGLKKSVDDVAQIVRKMYGIVADSAI